jgi:hypothetical protein
VSGISLPLHDDTRRPTRARKAALVTTPDHSSGLIRSLVAGSANEARSALRFAARSASVVQ